MKGVELSPKELMLVYNAMYQEEPGEFIFKYPFLDLDLFRYDVYKDEARNLVPSWKFRNETENRLGRASSFVKYDAPRWNDILDSFTRAGLLKFQNWSEVKSKLASILADHSDRTMNPKGISLAVDTNICYNRFLTRHLPFKSDKTTVLADNFHYVVSELVREELDQHINKKYHPSTINEMEDHYKSNLVRELSNGSAKNNRKAKNASLEVTYLLNDLGGSQIPFVGERSTDKEEIDRMIVRSYADHQRESGRRYYMLTCDQDMAFHAQSSGLPSVICKVPHYLPNHIQCTSGKWTTLVYELALSFGIIQIEGVGTIFSEWRGKDHSSYMRSEVKVVFDDKKMYEKVSWWLDRCRVAMKYDAPRY